MKRLDVFSRRGCHLCDVLLEALIPLVRGRAEIAVHDVDARADLVEAYGSRVPVVEYDGEAICQYHLDPDAIARILDESAA